MGRIEKTVCGTQRLTGDLDQAVAWLRSRQRFGVKPGLERARRVLAWLGNPHDGLRFYHVAGTNGKGSVCAFLTALLGRCGKVGTFTSPAFDGFRGRFMIDRRPVDDHTFAQLAARVMAASEAASDPADPLTEFEALTIMAILYFHDERVEHIVWETGLGGRFDSTNVVMPVVTAITNVSYDHMDVLGRTIPEIADQKAGIIKPGVPVITAAQDSAYVVIERIAYQMNAPVWRHGVQFGHVREAAGFPVQRMQYRGRFHDLYGLPVPLFGRHQCVNAAIAIAMYEAACQAGHCAWLPDAEVRSALADTVWPGRFEVHLRADGLPLVLDGAHNADGAAKLRDALEELARALNLPTQGWTMVVGVLQDKEIYPMLDAVLPLAASVIVTRPDVNRAWPVARLAETVATRTPNLSVHTATTVQEALGMAMEQGRPVCCWGSLYTVDEARQAIKQQKSEFFTKGR